MMGRTSNVHITLMSEHLNMIWIAKLSSFEFFRLLRAKRITKSSKDTKLFLGTEPPEISRYLDGLDQIFLPAP